MALINFFGIGVEGFLWLQSVLLTNWLIYNLFLLLFFDSVFSIYSVVPWAVQRGFNVCTDRHDLCYL